MLKHLEIKNFALIEELELEFGTGLNIITGETGAGKSIIVDALMLALGERANTSMIRDGAPKATIEAIFDVSAIPLNPELCTDFDLDDNKEIILRREISAKGSSRCFINDSPVQLTLLNKFGELLVDFHGQHEHQSLLRKSRHIEMLDKFALDENIKSKYSVLFTQLNDAISSYRALIQRQKNQHEKNEAAENELSRLKKISPRIGELESIETELKILDNNETILKITDEIICLLSESENSVINGANTVRKLIDNLIKIDDTFSVYSSEMASSLITMNEILNFTRDYKFRLDFSEERAAELRKRYLQLNSLRKSYSTIEDAIKRQNALEAELSSVLDFQLLKDNLEKEIHKLKDDISFAAEEISDRRRAAAEKMENEIKLNLAELGIEYGNFKAEFSYIEAVKNEIESPVISRNGKNLVLNPSGLENIEFFLSANRGESLKPLSEVASGGEVSRIMLSIKNMIAGKDSVCTMIFDEIDTGISGRIAQKVGLSMKKLSGSKQVIAITHLAQIASLADLNILVEKNEISGKSLIHAHEIKGEEKIIEIAKLISGEEITEASLKSVVELSRAGDNYGK